tara:strand:+ start:19041 stop:21344 length:2304 start_codon:yes stop_codon:yes gene_type:complete
MAETIKRSFTAGEISPSLQSRADLSKYTNGLALCENFIVRSQGGVYSRPGMRFIGEVDNSTKRARLIPFQFNTEQTYILVFEHLKMSVIKDGAYVLNGASRFELVTPYTEAQLSRIGFTQSADVMTLVHHDHDPANLSRLDHDNWTLVDINYAPTVTPPVFSVPPTVKNISHVTNANPARVTATGHGFTTGNLVTIDGVGGMTELNGRDFTITVITVNSFELIGEDSGTHTAYTTGGTATRQNGITTVGQGPGDFDKTYVYVITAVDVDGVESLISSSVNLTTKSLSSTAGIRLQWGIVADAEYYRVYKDPSNNTAIYGWIGDSKNVTFDDFNVAPLTSDAPPNDRQPFTDVNSKPSVVTYYQQRQIFANTLAEPQTVFTTQTNNFKSLRVSSPTKADDGVTFTVASRQVNEIRHLISLDALVLLTSGGEFRMTEGQDQVLTPSTIGVRPQSYNGASFVPPVIIDNTAVYVQEKGTKLRDLNFNGDVYAGNDLSIMAEHLFKGHNIIEMTYADEPYGVIWCVRDDGVLLGLTYQREHQVWAWHRHTTDGSYESIATVTEDGRDAVYVTVNRTINGATRRYVERIEPRFDDESANVFAVDSGLSYNGTPVTMFAGLDHLEGKTVVILADGIVIKNKVVTGGAVTLSRAASKVHIGLPYTPVIETLDIDSGSMIETLKAKQISVSLVTIETLDSRGGWVGGILDDGSYEMAEIKPRFDTDGYNAINLKSSKSEVSILPGWPQGGKIRIEQRDPLPLTITSIIPELDISG